VSAKSHLTHVLRQNLSLITVKKIPLGVTLQVSFTPGGIHDSFDFSEKELQAGHWVLELIKHGYVIPFTKEPEEEELENNASVKNNQQVAEEQVKLLLQQGVLRKVSVKPHYVNPLGLV